MEKIKRTHSTIIALLFIILSIFETKAQETPAVLTKYEAINKHSQIYANSCIPSSIEIVLKLNKKVDSNFYNYQKIWENKIDGTFANFDIYY